MEDRRLLRFLAAFGTSASRTMAADQATATPDNRYQQQAADDDAGNDWPSTHASSDLCRESTLIF